MNRRDFIRNGCGTCLSLAVASTFLSSCVSTKYTAGKLEKDGLVLSKKDFELNQEGSTAHRSFLVIRNEALLFPVCVYRFSDDEYSALWMKCTHQGAELQASGDVLQCPAHGSEFSNRGMATNGPAAQSLRSFPVTVRGNEIFIDLRKPS